MKAARSTARNLQAGLIVYLTSAVREQLKEVLKAEGVYSTSSWLRQQIMAKLKDAAARESLEPMHAGR
jgi:hypothetical protein